MDIANYHPYNFVIETVTDKRSIIVDERCNGFTCINQGDDTAIVNGVMLHPGSPTANGESWAIGGNLGEIFRGRIDIKFEGVGTAPQLLVIQKIYL